MVVFGRIPIDPEAGKKFVEAGSELTARWIGEAIPMDEQTIAELPATERQSAREAILKVLRLPPQRHAIQRCLGCAVDPPQLRSDAHLLHQHLPRRDGLPFFECLDGRLAVTLNTSPFRR